jgi:hypothetical protein
MEQAERDILRQLKIPDPYRDAPTAVQKSRDHSPKLRAAKARIRKF